MRLKKGTKRAVPSASHVSRQTRNHPAITVSVSALSPSLGNDFLPTPWGPVVDCLVLEANVRPMTGSKSGSKAGRAG